MRLKPLLLTRFKNGGITLASVVNSQKNISNSISSLVFHINEDEIDCSFSTKINLEYLHGFREQIILKESKSRQIYSKVNLIQHRIFEGFFDYYLINSTLPDFNRHEVLRKWEEFYTILEYIQIPSLEGGVDDDREIADYANNLDRLFTEF